LTGLELLDGVVEVAGVVAPAVESVGPSPPLSPPSSVVPVPSVVPAPYVVAAESTGALGRDAMVAGWDTGGAAVVGLAAGEAAVRDATGCTTTRRRSAASAAFGTRSCLVAAWITTAVANADAAAINAICGQVSRTERSRLIMAR
jgi:hypothetical protein